MTTRTLRILLILLIPLVALAAKVFGETPSADAEPAVRIYLPRTKTVDKATLTLNDIAIISGRDDALAARIRDIKLGRSPFAGESITLTRQTVLSQLGAAQISGDTVSVIGSSETRVHRKATDISTDDIVAAAEAFLKASPPAGAIRWKLAHQPQDIAIPQADGATLRCELDASAPAGQVHIRVTLATDEKVLASRLVMFRLSYQTKQLLAAKDINPGETITPANTTLETVEVSRPPSEVYTPPFGKRARAHITPGSVITDSHVHMPQPEVVIQRNETVRLKIQGKGWSITALGQALQNGRVGDTIRVRNLDSRQIIVGQVDASGVVIPMTAGGEVAVAKEQQP